MFLLYVAAIIVVGLLLRRLNHDYYLLALCKRVKCVDGSDVNRKVCTIPGKTIFGNNFDIMNMTPRTIFDFLRESKEYAKGKSYMLHFLNASVYNITNAEEAEEVLQSPKLITKSVVYDNVKPFLGEGLLTSTDHKWHFRRKIITPAFHFNILQSFLEVFKEESHKLIDILNGKLDQPFALADVIPQFSLNCVCETALGVKLDNIAGSKQYRHSIHNIEAIAVQTSSNPLMYYPVIFYLFGEYKLLRDNLHTAHNFSSKIIERKRKDFIKNETTNTDEQPQTDIDIGKKKRYAMLDTLLDAERKGFIDHQGICDEVNTFMFEGYDTTSTCLMFALLNFAWRPDMQEKCLREVENIDDVSALTIFDLNQLEYLECVIKETLRLYPSVPFIARSCTENTIVNGLYLPKGTQINLHLYDIMRDPRHFPDPLLFDPNRFLPENTTSRHPFAFVPFSAGPRNCIGQKFALLEIKVLLVAILRNFIIKPVTDLQSINFENGLVLRTEQKTSIKLLKRTL